MKCLLIAATAKEIGPFIEKYRDDPAFAPPGLTIDLLISGIGLTATTWALARQLQLNRPDIIIQAGIAGSFVKTISLGEVVVVTKDTIADQGVMEQKTWHTVFDLGLAPASQPPYQRGWLFNKHKDLLQLTGLKKVAGISVNQVTTSRQLQQLFVEKFNPITESMEGAALHFAALSAGIPFIQLRSISNYTGERNKSRWKIKESVTNLNNELIKYVVKL